MYMKIGLREKQFFLIFFFSANQNICLLAARISQIVNWVFLTRFHSDLVKILVGFYFFRSIITQHRNRAIFHRYQ